nr:uncharacterized protein LOC109188615 [Ipomoea batatas]
MLVPVSGSSVDGVPAIIVGEQKRKRTDVESNVLNDLCKAMDCESVVSKNGLEAGIAIYHLPLVLMPIAVSLPPRRKRFCFNNMWLREEACREIVQHSWSKTVGLSVMDRVESTFIGHEHGFGVDNQEAITLCDHATDSWQVEESTYHLFVECPQVAVNDDLKCNFVMVCWALWGNRNEKLGVAAATTKLGGEERQQQRGRTSPLPGEAILDSGGGLWRCPLLPAEPVANKQGGFHPSLPGELCFQNGQW